MEIKAGRDFNYQKGDNNRMQVNNKSESGNNWKKVIAGAFITILIFVIEEIIRRNFFG